MPKIRIDENYFHKSKLQNEDSHPNPCYGKGGGFLKIFDEVGVLSKLQIVEIEEPSSLGPTDSPLRFLQQTRALYFYGTIDIRSIHLNVTDILNIRRGRKSLGFLKFLFSIPFKDFTRLGTISLEALKSAHRNNTNSQPQGVVKRALSIAEQPPAFIDDYLVNLNNGISTRLCDPS